MKTIYLHIGTEKTATTSLQRFFCLNRSRLVEAGIWYPCSERLDYFDRDAHFPLPASLFDDCPDFVSPQKHADSEALFGTLVRDIQARKEPAVLLSSEHFSSRCSRSDRVRAIRRLLHGFRVRVIVYVRPQRELLVSAYSTFLQSGGKKTLDEVARGNWLKPQAIYFNYLRMLEPWWEAFGTESVVVRVFQPSRLVDRSVFGDVLSVLGIRAKDAFALPERLNTTISGEAAEFLYLANQHFPSFNEGDREGWELGQRFRAEAMPLFSGGSSIKHLLSPELIADTEALYGHDNAELARIARPDLNGVLFANDATRRETVDNRPGFCWSEPFVAWIVDRWKAARSRAAA
jgi:hypothetical protein